MPAAELQDFPIDVQTKVKQAMMAGDRTGAEAVIAKFQEETKARLRAEGVDVQFRRRLLYALIPLCLFVAGYCVTAASASGGWHTDREGEPYYSAPVHHSREFYTGLRWSVMLVGGIMAVASCCWGHPKVCAVFGAVAVLFNPILAIHLSKGTWEFIDLLTFWVFLVGPGFLWPSDADASAPAADQEAPKAEPNAAADGGGM